MINGATLLKFPPYAWADGEWGPASDPGRHARASLLARPDRMGTRLIVIRAIVGVCAACATLLAWFGLVGIVLALRAVMIGDAAAVDHVYGVALDLAGAVLLGGVWVIGRDLVSCAFARGAVLAGSAVFTCVVIAAAMGVLGTRL